MEKEVRGINLFGEKINIPVSRLYFRPSSYGLVINGDKIALVRAQSTGRYFFPGGGVDLGETMEEAMRREINEETGLIIKDATLIDCNELFFEYTPTKDSFHSIQFFYLCTVDDTTMIAHEDVQDEEAEKPQWVDIDSLTGDQFQSFGSDIVDRLLEKIQV